MKRMQCCFLVAVLLDVFLPIQAVSQIAVGLTDEDRAEFARHRAALYERIGDNVAVVFGAYSRGDNLRFRQDNRFYYLTGVEQPFCALLLNGKEDKTTLFLAQRRPGRSQSSADALVQLKVRVQEDYGIEDVGLYAELESVLKSLIPEGGTVLTVPAPEETIAGSEDAGRGANAFAERVPWAGCGTREDCIKAWLESLVQGVSVDDLAAEIDDLRRVKTPWEIERMTRACEIAAPGYIAAWQATEPGVYEYQIEGAAQGAFISGGAFYPGYTAIVGSGSNSLILHYQLNCRRAEDGEFILMDFGPDYKYYCADISRTWPVNGKFSPEQRKAYLDCLEIQKKIIETVKPGATLMQLTALNQKLMHEMGYSQNFRHGPSHYLGMAVHDVGNWGKPLEPGVVITVEPGIYFQDRGWGIRIEDNVLVTEDGCRVLSDMIPKHPDEIEAIMAGAGSQAGK
jgi:Xaa-Pro aminopeptidase